MNQTRQLLATATLAASALFSAGALAQEATPDTWTAVPSSPARAAVVAGQASVFAEGYIEPVRASTVLRADVRQQTLQAIRSGEVKAINAEVAGVSPAAVQAKRNAG